MTKMNKLRHLLVAAVLVSLLGGCAGALLLALSAYGTGRIVGQIEDLFGEDPDSFTVYFDGYDTGVHPAQDRTIDLSGLPIGDHVITVSNESLRIGFHANVSIIQGQSVNLAGQTPIQAGTITGRVQRQVNGSTLPVAGVRVAAIFGGANLVSQAGGSIINLPPSGDQQVILGFTDNSGNFRLGPAAFGDWLITTAYPGAYADAVLETVGAGNDAGNINLVLREAAGAQQPATIRGTVAREGGGQLSDALIAAELGSPFQPQVDPNRLPALQSAAGMALLDQPWFSWRSLATVSDAAGAYDFEVPPGTHEVYGFRYGYRAEAATITLSAGQVQTANFSLEPR